MSGFEPASSALGVAHLATLVIELVKKVVAAQAEVQIWLDKVRRIQTLLETIAKIMKSRQQVRQQEPRPEIPDRIAERIKDSVSSCEVCLRHMRSRLEYKHGDNGSSRGRRITHSIKYVFTKEEIELQSRILDDNVKDISLSLQLLHNVDQAATHEFVLAIWNLLSNNTGNLSISPHEGEPNDGGVSISQREPNNEAHDAGPLSLTREFGDLDYPATADDQNKLLGCVEKPILFAVREKEIEDVEKLLGAHEDSGALHARDDNEWTVLHHAVRNKDPEMLRLLLDSGLGDEPGFIDVVSKQGHTALMGAAKYSDYAEGYEMADMLIAKKCDIDFPEEGGQTALALAIENPPRPESERFARLLVDNGADIMAVYKQSPRQLEKYTYLHNLVREKQARSEGSGESLRKKISRRFSRSIKDRD